MLIPLPHDPVRDTLGSAWDELPGRYAGRAFFSEGPPMNVDKLLDDITRRPRSCKICADEKLARMVARWLDRKADPEDDCMVPLETFTRALRGPDGTTMRRHVERCLRRDHLTGAPLGD